MSAPRRCPLSIPAICILALAVCGCLPPDSGDVSYGSDFSALAVPRQYTGPMRQGSTSQSSTIHVLPKGVIACVDSDHDEVVFLENGTRTSVPTGAGPFQMAWHRDRLVVTNLRDRTITILSIPSRTVLATVRVGAEPVGVTFIDERRVIVALQAEDAVVIVDVEDGVAVDRIALASAKPRSVAFLANGLVQVSHLLGGVTTMVNPVTRATSERLGDANSTMVGSIVVTPDGATAMIPATRTVQASQVPAYYALTADSQTAELVQGDNVFGPRRVASLNVDPDFTAAALLDGLSSIATLSRGTHTLRISPLRGLALDSHRDTRSFSIEVGHGADGLALGEDGKTLYVHNAFDLTIQQVDLGFITAGYAGAACRVEYGCNALEPIVSTHAFSVVTLEDDVRVGRNLFYDATDTAMTNTGFACASCHVEGRNDGRTWVTPNGPRNTPNLSGARPGIPGIASTTAPLHWDGELATSADLSLTVERVMHGDGVSREKMALLTYVWGKMTTEAGSVKGVLMAVGVAKLEEETHG